MLKKKRTMRFKKAEEKYTKKVYWIASACKDTMPRTELWYLIYPHGSGFNLFRKSGWGRKGEKLCHVRRFDSAKEIANLMEHG